MCSDRDSRCRAHDSRDIIVLFGLCSGLARHTQQTGDTKVVNVSGGLQPATAVANQTTMSLKTSTFNNKITPSTSDI